MIHGVDPSSWPDDCRPFCVTGSAGLLQLVWVILIENSPIYAPSQLQVWMEEQLVVR